MLQDNSALEDSPYFLWMDSNPVWRRPKMLKCISEANPIYFAPHIRAPKVMIRGRYDEAWLFKSASEPLYQLPPEPKQLEVLDGGHSVALEVSVPILERLARQNPGTGQARVT